MLDVQHSISGALLPVMPRPDTSATPNSNSCHRDSKARRRQRADWRGSREEGRWGGGTTMELLAHCWGPAAPPPPPPQTPPPSLQPDVVDVVLWVQCWKATHTHMHHGKAITAYFIKALELLFECILSHLDVKRLWMVCHVLKSPYSFYHNGAIHLPSNSSFVISCIIKENVTSKKYKHADHTGLSLQDVKNGKSHKSSYKIVTDCRYNIILMLAVSCYPAKVNILVLWQSTGQRASCQQKRG